MIDTHAHIDTEAFDTDREDTIRRAIDAGVENIIIPSIEPRTFKNLLRITEKNDRIFCGLGIHPHNANDANTENLNEILNEAKKNGKVVAIGEIGLDYYYDFAPKTVQKNVFREQLNIAKDLDLPVIIHNRDSSGDIMEIIREEQDGRIKGVFHCFSGDVRMMEELVEKGFHISFTGNITYNKSKLTEVVLNIPLESILLETDSPWMAPIPHRGKRNEPAFIGYIAQKIAEIKSRTTEEVKFMTTLAAKTLFRLSVFLILLLGGQNYLAAQDKNPTEEAHEQLKHPYEKFLGLGPVIGVNTIVQTFYLGSDSAKDVSYEGIPFYGGTLNWGIWDYISSQFTYIYSKNTKVAEKEENRLGPTINQLLEITFIFIFNPYSKVNVYLCGGPSFIFNTINQGGGTPGDNYNEINEQKFALNGGLGFIANIPVKSIGLVTIGAEWRLDFDLAKSTGKYLEFKDPDNQLKNRYKDVETTTFYSLPRININFYPEIFDFR